MLLSLVGYKTLDEFLVEYFEQLLINAHLLVHLDLPKSPRIFVKVQNDPKLFSGEDDS